MCLENQFIFKIHVLSFSCYSSGCIFRYMKKKINVTLGQIARMDREQLIDYLLITWTDLVRQMPVDPQKQRAHFKNHRLSDMRECALSFVL